LGLKKGKCASWSTRENKNGSRKYVKKIDPGKDQKKKKKLNLKKIESVK